jgi:hypothetical protein
MFFAFQRGFGLVFPCHELDTPKTLFCTDNLFLGVKKFICNRPRRRCAADFCFETSNHSHECGRSEFFRVARSKKAAFSCSSSCSSQDLLLQNIISWYNNSFPLLYTLLPQLIQNSSSAYADNHVFMLVPPKSTVRGGRYSRRHFVIEVFLDF